MTRQYALCDGNFIATFSCGFLAECCCFTIFCFRIRSLSFFPLSPIAHLLSGSPSSDHRTELTRELAMQNDQAFFASCLAQASATPLSGFSAPGMIAQLCLSI